MVPNTAQPERIPNAEPPTKNRSAAGHPGAARRRPAPCGSPRTRPGPRTCESLRPHKATSPRSPDTGAPHPSIGHRRQSIHLRASPRAPRSAPWGNRPPDPTRSGDVTSAFSIGPTSSGRTVRHNRGLHTFTSTVEVCPKRGSSGILDAHCNHRCRRPRLAVWTSLCHRCHLSQSPPTQSRPAQVPDPTKERPRRK